MRNNYGANPIHRLTYKLNILVFARKGRLNDVHELDADFPSLFP